MTSTVDIALVAIIKAALTTINNRVYHMTVWQTLSSEDVYPCVVYERVDDKNFDELDGNSPAWNGLFAVYVLANTDAELRTLADTLKSLSGVFDTTGWQQWSGDVEQYDAPVEMQEIGRKQTQLQVSLIRLES